MKDEEEKDKTDLVDARSQFTSYLAVRLRDHNWFAILGDVNAVSMESLIMFVLGAAIEKKPMITLFICSPGGDESSARAVVGAIDFAKTQGVIVRAFGAGEVASAAFDIFISCTRGYRFVHEVSMLMTHSSEVSTRSKRMGELQDVLDELTLKTFTRITKPTREKFLATGDWYLSPEEALEWGIADAIVSFGRALPTLAVFPPPRHKKEPEPEEPEPEEPHKDKP